MRVPLPSISNHCALLCVSKDLSTTVTSALVHMEHFIWFVRKFIFYPFNSESSIPWYVVLFSHKLLRTSTHHNYYVIYKWHKILDFNCVSVICRRHTNAISFIDDARVWGESPIGDDLP